VKFIIAKDELARIVSRGLNVVSAKPSMPILSNLLIEASGGVVTLTATDLVVGVRCCAPAKVLEEGSTTLPAKTLSSLVRELTALNIEVTTGSNEITEMVSGSSRFKLHGMSRNEFPELPDLSGAEQAKIPRGAFHEALYRTAFASSREDNRFILTGVLIKIEAGQMSFVGTDGKRLAKASISAGADATAEGQYVLPAKAVDELLKGLAGGNDEEEVSLFFLSDRIAVQTAGFLVMAKLLTGDYPDYRRVIPNDVDTGFSLHREELISLLRQISLFMAEASHSVRFSFSDGELSLSSNTSKVGEGHVSMPVNYTGDRLDIAFNPSFFIDILRHCQGETVNLELTDAFNPGKIRDPEAEEALYVLMPMRLNE
jgi:DNA polymerase-3 subunit beta